MEQNWDRVYPHYSFISKKFEETILSRPGLDRRTRILTMMAQCTAIGEIEELVARAETGLKEGVITPSEALEIAVQASIPTGQPRCSRAGRALMEMLSRLGLLDKVAENSLLESGTLLTRDKEAESKMWPMFDETMPKRAEYMEKYGWQGISTGLRVTPRQHPRSVAWLDGEDEDFCKAWLDFVFAGVYSRGVLDDKTRTLCIYASCISCGELNQSENHMRNAILHLGASQTEIREIIFQTAVICGMPRALNALHFYKKVLDNMDSASNQLQEF